MNQPTDALRGRFLVIDGPDGGGKSTQQARLAEALRRSGLEVVCVRDPGGTPIGDRIRAILLDPDCGEMGVECELMLYMASRAQLVAELVRPALGRGACVICDRYISSTIAYQGAAGADVEAIRRVGDVAVGGLWPDLTVVLDVPADVGLARALASGKPDRIEARALDYHRRVREGFLAQARREPGRFALVDASTTPDEVHAAVCRAVTGLTNEEAGT
jgi:dTMP kinase